MVKQLLDLTLFNHQIYLCSIFYDWFLVLASFFVLYLIIIFFRGLR